MKVFVSKYSLTRGIQVVEGEVLPQGYFSSKDGIISKGEWAEFRKDAIYRAYQKRDKKIKSLEKQIDKLKKLTFE